MKKNIIAKIFTVVLLMIYVYFNKGIYAVDLEFLANVTKGPTVAEINANEEASKTKQTEQIAIIRTFSKKYGSVDDDDNKVWSWYNDDVTGGQESYMTYGISFWGNRLSADYSETETSKWLKSTYDETSGFIKTETENPAEELPKYNLIKNNDGSVKYIWPVNKNRTPDLTFSLEFKNGSKFYRKRTMDIKQPDGYAVTVHDTVITKSGIDTLLEKYYKNGDTTYVKNGYLKIRFSVLAHTSRSNYTEMAPSLDGKMPTAYYAALAASTMLTHNLGYVKDENENYVGKSGTSILNYYDNWLYIPIAKLNARTVEIRYKVKDENGNWNINKTETKQIDTTKQSFTKSSIGDLDKYYIGGKVASGTTKTKAESNLQVTEKNWGWNQSSITIPASNNEEYYIVELYYDYREIAENHLKTNGDVINSSWNKTHKLITKEEITLKAKNPYVYYNNEKYVHVSTKVDGDEYVASVGKQVKFTGLDGENSLKYGDEHHVYFYYEFEPARKVYVRHFVFNDDTGKYEISDILTNSNAAIKDGADNKYYLRANGYNQRLLKMGEKNYIDAVVSGFNEQYTIDFSDTIKLDKSRTIENEGTLYEYKGVKIKNNEEPNLLTTKAQADTLDKTKTTVILNPEKIEKTYVDFYYTESDILVPGDVPEDDPDYDPDVDPDDEPSDEPTIDFVPKNDEGEEIGIESTGQVGKCKVVYVPSGENLKAYMTATTYRPYSLIYNSSSIDETTGEITYKLEKYDVYKFVNGAIQNNSNSNYGYINSTDKKGVFNTNSDTIVNPIVSNITSEVEASITKFQDLNPNTVTTVSDGRKTTEVDFGNDNVHKINYDKYNGVRNPSGTANYNVVSLVSGGNIVNGVNGVNIGTKSVGTKNNTQVNVYTPATIEKLEIESEVGVNHSNKETLVIQSNSEFKVTPKGGAATDYQNIESTEKYIKYYWFVTDFDVKLLDTRDVYDKNSNKITSVGSGQIVSAGNLIKIPKGGALSGVALNVGTAGGSTTQSSSNLKVIAVTYNVTDEVFEKKIINNIKASSSSDSFVANKKIAKVLSNCELISDKQSHKALIETIGELQVNTMYDDAYYFVESAEESKILGRIYDFRITDCLDVNFKNVFRKSTAGNVNDLRGIKYFSGIRRLLVYGGNGIQIGANQSNQNNIFADISSSDDSINSVATKTILPLGPYKHVDSNYLQAPKLGYRISFDLKTSGTYVKSSSSMVRYIKITPKYYYISKDGKTYKENINLYYKNSSGKYVNFEGGGYTIYFKPNDGYRTIYNAEDTENIKDMSTKLEALKIGGTSSSDTSFKLTDSMMSYSNNNFVQAWYGEFKLPNSTIVVEVDENGKKDINNPLSDGYIGVIFNIECVDEESGSETTIISYSQNDKSAISSTNTSQWDYEGYLGFQTSNIGSELNGELRIQLEKDVWRISSDMYKKIKGTVVLYDIDDRAANDFD